MKYSWLSFTALVGGLLLVPAAAFGQAWDDVPNKSAQQQLPNEKPAQQQAAAPQISAQELHFLQLRLGRSGLPPEEVRKIIEQQTHPAQTTAAADGWAKYQTQRTHTALDPNAHVVGMPEYKQTAGDFSAHAPTSFFGGITREQIEDSKDVLLPVHEGKQESPAWAKLKPTRQFVEGTEHFGNEDNMGFY